MTTTAPVPVPRLRLAGTTVAAVIGGALVSLGSVLPWGTVSGYAPSASFSAAGTSAIVGNITLGLGVVIVLGAIGTRTAHRRTARRFGLVSTLLAVGLGVLNLADVSDLTDRARAVSPYVRRVDVGVGLYLVVAGAVLALVAHVREGRRRPVVEGAGPIR